MRWPSSREWLLAMQAGRLPVLAFTAGHFCDRVRVHWRDLPTLLSDAPNGPQSLYRRPVDVRWSFPVSDMDHADWGHSVIIPVAPCWVEFRVFCIDPRPHVWRHHRP